MPCLQCLELTTPTLGRVDPPIANMHKLKLFCDASTTVMCVRFDSTYAYIRHLFDTTPGSRLADKDGTMITERHCRPALDVVSALKCILFAF
jgi:hypothetical protein